MLRARRLAPFALVALALVAARGPSARAEDGDERTKTFKDKNFRLTLPAEWAWEEVSDGDKVRGFVLLARRTIRPGSVETTVRVRVVDAGGASVDSLLGQIKDQKTTGLKEAADSMDSMTWAGVSAKRLVISGTYENGGKVAYEVYGAVVAGQFHQMDVRSINGAEEKVREEIDALVTGYKLLAGGGSSGGGAKPDGGKDDPNAKKFAKLGLAWSLPEPGTVPTKDGTEEFRWSWDPNDGNPDLAKGEKGLLARCGIDGSPNPVLMELFLYPDEPGVTAEGIIKDDNAFDKVEQNFSDHPAPRIDTEATVGNWRGASRTLNGKDKQEPPRLLYIKIWFVSLKGSIFQIFLVAHDDAEKKYKDSIHKCLEGLRWADTKEGVRGPWVVPFPSVAETRGDAVGVGKETQDVLASFTLKKPAAFGKLKYDATVKGFEDWMYAAEARKDGAYCFVGIRRVLLKALQEQTPPKLPETFIDDYEATWKNEMGEPVTLTQRGGKANKKADVLANAKGHFYEFRGTKEGNPFVARGWVVKSGQYVYWVQVQLGGKDAEAALGKDAAALLKSLKFD